MDLLSKPFSRQFIQLILNFRCGHFSCQKHNLHKIPGNSWEIWDKTFICGFLNHYHSLNYAKWLYSMLFRHSGHSGAEAGLWTSTRSQRKHMGTENQCTESADILYCSFISFPNPVLPPLEEQGSIYIFPSHLMPEYLVQN